MAQDFKAAFYPGTDDKTITTLEADGVALAAIPGLNQKLKNQLRQKDAELKAQQRQIAELISRLSTVELSLKASPSK